MSRYITSPRTPRPSRRSSTAYPAAGDAGLAAAWRLDGAASGLTDIAGAGADLQLGLAAARAPATTADGALAFNGVDDTVEIPDAPSLRPAAALTLEAWFTDDDSSGSLRSLVGKPVGTSYLDSYAIWFQNGQLHGGTNANDVAFNFTPVANVWHHVAFTADASGFKLYLDGVLEASNATPAALAYDNQPLVIGGDYNYGSWGYPWLGKIRDVRLYDATRSAAQIQADMTQPVVGNEAHLVGAWKLSSDKDGVIVDSTANANTGVAGQNINGRPQWTADSALGFDGVHDYVEFGSPADNKLNLKYESSIEADVRFDSLPNGDFATILNKDTGSDFWLFGYANNYRGVANGLSVYVRDATTGQISVVGSTAWTPTLGVWNHVAVVKTGLTYAFYLNGQPLGSAVATANVNANTAPLIVGLDPGYGHGLNGAIRNLSLWSRALSPAEVLASANQPPQGGEAGLAGAWKFSEGAGILAHDLTPAGNDGALGATRLDRPAFVATAPTAPVTTSLLFNGAEQVVHIGNLGARPPQGALSFWMNSSDVDNYRNVLTTGPLPVNDTTGSNGAIRFEQSSNGAFSVVIGATGGATFTSHEFTPSLTSGTWTHIALVWDSTAGRVRGYLDGELVFDDSNTTWPDTFSDMYLGAGFATGSYYPNRSYAGRLAEVQYWSVALDAAGVAATMTPRNGTEAGLTDYWPLSAGSGAVAADLTALARNGTMGTGDVSTVPLWSTQHAVVVDNEGGVVSGSGVIAASVVNAGTVAPGGTNAVGEILVTGSYTQTSAGALTLDIGGLTPGVDFDRLDVLGSATIAGALNASYTGGFTPGIGGSFEVVSFASASGAFGSFSGTANNLTVNYETLDVNLLDVAGSILVSPTSGLTTTEAGGTAQFSVVLGRAPSADVVIDVISSDPTEGTPSVTQLVFTPQNWNVPQIVTVTGQDDQIVHGDIAYQIVLKPAVSADPSFDGLDPTDVALVNKEGDHVGIVFSTPSLTTVERGPSQTFTVALASKPLADVTVPLRSGNTGEGTINVASLVFTPSNWNVAQTVTVTPVDDGVVGGDVGYTVLVGPAASDDAHYNGLASPGVAVVNKNADLLDLQIAGFSLIPASGLQSGQSVVVNWTVANIGNVAASTVFSDYLVVRNKTTAATVANLSLAYDPAVSGAIAPGGTRARTATVALPDGPIGAGDLEFALTIDGSRGVAQSNYANDTATLVTTSALPAYPDLQVRNLGFNPAQPLVSGTASALLWNDVDTGASAATKAWTDHVVIRNTTTGETLFDATLPYDGAASPLVSGATLPRTYAFTLPNGARGSARFRRASPSTPAARSSNIPPASTRPPTTPRPPPAPPSARSIPT